MLDRVVHVIVSINVINHDKVFQKSLDAPTRFRSCLLTRTLSFLYPMHTFPAFFQTCAVCYMLGGTSYIDGAYAYLRLGLCKLSLAPSCNKQLEKIRDSIVYTAACTFVSFLLSPIRVIRFDIFKADMCIGYWQEKHSRKRKKRIKMRSSVFLQRKKYLDRCYLSVLGFASRGFKNYT